MIQSLSPPDPQFGDDSNETVHVENLSDTAVAPSIAIVEAIAGIEDIDPVDSQSELGIRLYDYLDPTALDQIIRSDGGSETVTIDLTIENANQYSVQVQDSGRLVVEKIG